jgi:hypothetical protein
VGRDRARDERDDHSGVRRTPSRPLRRTLPARTNVASIHIGLERYVYGALFLLVALVFSTRLEVQFTLPKLVVLRLFAPILALLIAACVASISGYLSA